MTVEITQRELRNNSGQIMQKLDAGEEFVVTRNGVPVGQLSPLRSNQFVTSELVLSLFRGAPAIDAEQFRKDLDEVADQSVAPRG